MNFNIRPAHPNDLHTIADFNVKMALETEGKTLAPEQIEPGVKALLEDALKGKYYLAVQDEKILGQLMITYEWSDWRNSFIWWIQSVYVDMPYRREVVYKALYEKVKQEAQEAGVSTIRLYVEKNNTRAQDVYERLGMEETIYKMYEATLL